jgi:hypothetical protein
VRELESEGRERGGRVGTFRSLVMGMYGSIPQTQRGHTRYVTTAWRSRSLAVDSSIFRVANWTAIKTNKNIPNKNNHPKHPGLASPTSFSGCRIFLLDYEGTLGLEGYPNGREEGRSVTELQLIGASRPAASPMVWLVTVMYLAFAIREAHGT